MSKYEEIASNVVACIGGKDNIVDAYHCMTRLRFHLKDKSGMDEPALRAVPGVMGVTWPASGELQVIIGTEVDDVYKALVAQTGIQEKNKIDENLDAASEKQKFSIKGVMNSIMNAFSGCMNPLVPIFVLVGVFNVVAALIGPSFLKLVTEESDLYTNFYNVGQAVVYFLPVFLAIPAARYFKCNQYLSLVLACLLVYPDFISAVETGAYTMYGIPATSATYTSSVLPIILTVWVQSYVEKLANRISPKSLKVIMFPFLTVAIMLPLTFCVLGPAGTLLGTGLANAIVWLNTVAGPAETAIVSAVMPFLTAFGIGRPIFFVTMAMLFANGVEYAYMPLAICLSNFVAMGVALGFALKLKGERRQLGMTSFIACCLGGVSEPTWFGIFLPNKKTILPAVIGGAVGGLYVGIMKVGYYQFGPSNFLSVLGFVSSDVPSNLLHGCIAAAISFVVTLVLELVLYKDNSAEKA